MSTNNDIELWFASAKMGRSEDLKELISIIKNINCVDELGNTALHYACQGNHIECIQILINSKVNVNIQNKLGETAAHKV